MREEDLNQKVVEAIRVAMRPMPNPCTNGEFIYQNILGFFVGVGHYAVEVEQIREHTYLSDDEIERLLKRLVDEEILTKTTRDSIFDDPDDCEVFYKLNIDRAEEAQISADDDERQAAADKADEENMKKVYTDYVNSKRPKQYIERPTDSDSDDDEEEDGPSSQPFTRNSL